MAQQGKAKSLKDLNEIRSLIKKHKKNDFLFAATGMFVIASLTITLIILFLIFWNAALPSFWTSDLTIFGVCLFKLAIICRSKAIML